MKQCPVCKNTYTDDSLQFCLADGATLFSTSVTSEVTQQFPGGTNPIRIDFGQSTSPTVVRSTVQPIPVEEPVKKKTRGWNLVIGLIAGFTASALIGALMFATFFWFARSGNNPVVVENKPNVDGTNSITKTPTPDDTENLKEKIANLEKQIQEQKKKNQTVPTIDNPLSNTAPTPPQSNKVTARVNSPNDGFLALRTEPSAETGERITQIPHGANVTVMGCLPKAPGKKARWCRVDYSGNIGWAYDGFLIY